MEVFPSRAHVDEDVENVQESPAFFTAIPGKKEMLCDLGWSLGDMVVTISSALSKL